MSVLGIPDAKSRAEHPKFGTPVLHESPADAMVPVERSNVLLGDWLTEHVLDGNHISADMPNICSSWRIGIGPEGNDAPVRRHDAIQLSPFNAHFPDFLALFIHGLTDVVKERSSLSGPEKTLASPVCADERIHHLLYVVKIAHSERKVVDRHSQDLSKQFKPL